MAVVTPCVLASEPGSESEARTEPQGPRLRALAAALDAHDANALQAFWLIKRIAEAPRKNIRFCLDVGTWEGNAMLASNRLLHSVLVGKGYDVVYHETPGTHSSYYWMLTLPDGLQTALTRSSGRPRRGK